MPSRKYPLLPKHILRLIAVATLTLGASMAWPATDAERIIESASARVISVKELGAEIAASDFVLLGELHDNPRHHQARGELVAALPGLASVVAEHMEQSRHLGNSGNLLSDLESAGFDAKAWRWPLHEAMFSLIAAKGTELVGGNIPRDLARQIAREGEAALPTELAEQLATAPLATADAAQLDTDLVSSHCGMLPEYLRSGLHLTQRARDAAMANALANTNARPAILLAGNGHVRRDYGVPTLLAPFHPTRKLVVVGFIEDSPELAARLPALRKQYDYLWITAATPRDDPCQQLKTGWPGRSN